jgi:hypothetical protein
VTTVVIGLLAFVAGLGLGLFYGERQRLLDLQHEKTFSQYRPAMRPTEEVRAAVRDMGEHLGIVRPPEMAPDTEREVSESSIQRAAQYLRHEAAERGIVIPPEEARRQAELMLAGEDV